MKKRICSVLLSVLAILASCSLCSACFFIWYQPEIPQK
ncbi:MAG: cyclic lactone autoinducer peptide [Firmicutes bacterium]|nr:cyclic lactone autoinducer peptide [Bacillota bacterium]HHT48047.1 cyclic lactone autoinducer peptide [Bacillota bacterium]